MADPFEKGGRGSEQMGSIEPMDDTKITIFGQGRFGTALVARLEQIKHPGISIVPVAEKMQNREEASLTSLAVIAVRPEQVEDMFAGFKRSENDKTIPLSTALGIDSQVLSFAANVSDKADVSLMKLGELANRPVARMMAIPPGWDIGAYILGDGFSKIGYEFIFDHLTRVRPIEFTDEHEFNGFGILLAQMHVAQLFEGAGRIVSADGHRRFVANKLNLEPRLFERHEIGNGSPEAALKTIATPGGVSARFIQALEETPDISPEMLFEKVRAEINEARERAKLSSV